MGRDLWHHWVQTSPMKLKKYSEGGKVPCLRTQPEKWVWLPIATKMCGSSNFEISRRYFEELAMFGVIVFLTYIFFTIGWDQRQIIELVVIKVGGADTGGSFLPQTPIVHCKVPWNSFSGKFKVCIPSCVDNQARLFSQSPEGSFRLSGKRARNPPGLGWSLWKPFSEGEWLEDDQLESRVNSSLPSPSPQHRLHTGLA